MMVKTAFLTGQHETTEVYETGERHQVVYS